MARLIAIDKVVKDDTIFPRAAGVDQDAVMRYRDAYEAGEELPPIILEAQSNRLLDGWHRLAAQRELKRDKVKVDFHVIPDGVPGLLYAAGLSSRHGVILSNAHKRQIALQVYGADSDMDLVVISTQLAVSEVTVRRWVDDIIQERVKGDARKAEIRCGCVAVLTTVGGWTQQAMGDMYAVSQGQINRDYQMIITTKDKLLTDVAYCAEVLASLPEEALQGARETINAWTIEASDELTARKEKAEIQTRWRDLEHAARLITAWVTGGATTPENTPQERTDYITQALTKGLDNLRKEQ